MLEALEGFETAVSINGKPITNLRFADDIDLNLWTNKEAR